MDFGIASDHRGNSLRYVVAQWLRAQGHAVWDAGPDGAERVDYPDFAARVAQRVAVGTLDRGILICGTGIGMAIAANKCPGVRAATLADRKTAEMSRRHNDINVACFGADLLEEDEVLALLQLFVETPFDGGRHARRLQKIAELEPGERGKSGELGHRVSS